MSRPMVVLHAPGEPGNRGLERRRNRRALRCRWQQWHSRHSEQFLVLALVVVTAVVHGTNLAGWPAYFDDEGTYLSQAIATYSGELAPYTYWYDHPPIGWLQLAAVAWLPLMFVETEIVGGRLSMVAFSMATTVLVYATARRLGMNRVFATAAVLLWALSPLTVLESRQVFLDTIAVPWLVGALFLALSPHKHLGHYMASGACLGVAVLTKETTVIFAPAVFLALMQFSHRSTRAFAALAFAMSLLAVSGSYLLFATLKGELLPGPGHVSLFDALVFQVAGRRGSGFILDPGSGAYGLLQFWLDYDRLLIIGGVAAALLGLFVARLRPAAVAVLACVLLALRPNGYLPFMYVTAMLPFAALAIAGLVDESWRRLGARKRGAGVDSTDQAWRTGLPRLALATALVAAMTPVAHGWVERNEVAMTADVNAAHPQVVAWMKRNVSTDAVVVTDNNYWLDLARAGWEPGWGVVWFTKLDLDPIDSRLHLPAGWRDVDYVIWSRSFDYLEDNDLPIVNQVYENSEVIATFGTTDADRVEIRRVMK